jgi:hypothetical protein
VDKFVRGASEFNELGVPRKKIGQDQRDLAGYQLRRRGAGIITGIAACFRRFSPESPPLQLHLEVRLVTLSSLFVTTGNTTKERQMGKYFGFLKTVVLFVLCTLYPAYGAVTFGPAQNYAVGIQPYGVALGDFNGDGKPTA